MNIKPSLYFLGLSCFPITLMSIINIFYCFYFKHLENINSYILVIILTLIIGFSLFFIGKKNKNKIDFYEELFLLILVYFLISFFISVPFYLSNYNISFLDSYFESMSGLTGTGFTIIDKIENIDDPLILWRSSSQWIGGMYFLIFLVLIFSNKQINLKMIDLSFNLEKKTNFSSNLITVTNKIFFIYLSLTVLIFLAFLTSEIRLFDSLNLSMTVISSGGFLPTGSLNDIIKNEFQSLILCFSFLLSILNFYLFYNFILARDNLKEHKEDIYIFILIISFSIIFYFINNLNLSSVFINILSSVGNSGISTSNVPANFTLYFIILTLIGGSVLSTTSGIKFLRIYILIKAFLMEMYRLVKPNVMINTKIMFSEKKINSENIKISFLVFILFFLSLFILSSILLNDFLDFENSFKLSILTLTNTAASNIYGIEDIKFTNLFTFSKISLIFFMIIAKIEMLAIFILFRKIFLKN